MDSDPTPAAERQTAGRREDAGPSAVPPSLAPSQVPTEPALSIEAFPAVPGFEVLGLLGKGGMGVVYRALHTRLKREVALKMVLAGARAGSQELARFQFEAEAVAHLSHPNIVQVYEVGEYEGLPYYSMEYIEGGTLASRLRTGPLGPRQAAAITHTLAAAMQAAHERGIIHRDLKPANILMKGGLMPKISDFGLARRLDVDLGQTQTGAILGTPCYLAPEQARGASKEATVAADIYALGVILYEMLVGRPPFHAPDILETLVQVVNDDPVPPRDLQRRVPRDLETICLKCLEKRPEQRYPSAAALAEDLRRFLAGEPIQARPVGRLERTLKWGRRHPGSAAGIAVAVLAGVVLALGGLTYQANLRAVNGRLTVALTDVTEQRDKAGKARAAERKQRLLVEERERSARQHLYVARMGLVPRALELGRVAQVADLLDSTRPEQTGGEDLRGWEWFHLYGHCHSELLTLQGHASPLLAVAVSPDGRSLASADDQGVILVWDAATGQARRRLEGFDDAVLSLAFSPDGRHLAAGSQDSSAALFEVATGRLLRRLNGHVLAVNQVAYSPTASRSPRPARITPSSSGMPDRAGRPPPCWATPRRCGACSLIGSVNAWCRPARTASCASGT